MFYSHLVQFAYEPGIYLEDSVGISFNIIEWVQMVKLGLILDQIVHIVYI